MDVGYIVGPGAGHELRYSLRSLSNLTHDRVFIAGYVPPWTQNVVGLPREQVSRRKFVNAGLNLLALCESDISEDFILFNDDFFVMEPMETLPVYHRGMVSDVLVNLRKRLGNGSSYVEGLEHTRVFLAENYGIENPVSYGLHVPMAINKTVMRTILLATNITAPAGRLNYHVRTIYGNVAKVGGERMRDVKVNTTANYTQYRPGIPFVSTSDRSFANGRIGRLIKAKFPDPSPYEQQSPSRRR